MEGAGAGGTREGGDESRGGRGVSAGGVLPWLCAGLVLAAAVPAAAQRSPVRLIDRVAVVAEGPSARDRAGQVATMWDVFVAAHVLLIREAGPGAFERWCDAAAYRDAQRRLVEDLIVLREAVRLGREALAPGMVDEARDQLAARLGGHDVLRAFLRERSISMESLDAALRREVIVARFTRDSVRLPATLEAAELEARFAEGGHPFAGRVLAEVAEEFEAWLRARQLEEYRQRWLVELRGRCRLIVNDVSQELAGAAPGEVG